MAKPPDPRNKYRILAYGFEKKGLPLPPQDMELPWCSVTFGTFLAAPRFQDFDGVIFFQGIFESFESVSRSFDEPYLRHTFSEDELDRRFRETVELISQGGLVCGVLTESFLDTHYNRGGSRDFSRTDLSKRVLAGLGVGRANFPTRVPRVRSQFDELSEFFKLFGAACSQLTPERSDINCRVLSKALENTPVGVVKNNQIFVVPSMVPKPSELEEFVSSLLTGVVKLWERFKQELPAWAGEYRFPNEVDLVQHKTEVSKEVDRIDSELAGLESMKRVLAYRDEPLVDAVMDLFQKALPLKPKREEDYHEDFELMDSSGVTVALVEVKGTSRGVLRAHVNQADTHRERGNRPHEFPSLLIVNAHLAKSTTLADRDHDIAPEQIQHAVQSNVLILRTLDLINLASQRMSGALDDERIIDLLLRSQGWLKVTATSAEVRSS